LAIRKKTHAQQYKKFKISKFRDYSTLEAPKGMANSFSVVHPDPGSNGSEMKFKF
jgi:hypothetical protein